MANKLYQFTLRALRQSTPGGALVPCYACAADHRNALTQAVAKLSSLDLRFDTVDGPVTEIDPAGWSSYVAKVWPDFAAGLPDANELSRILAQGGVFFGPIAGFDQPASRQVMQ